MIVDVLGEEAALGEKAISDVTHRRFEPVVADLLPRGPAWNPTEDSVLRRLIAALSTELSRAERRGRKLQQELNPATSFECLADWEESYGLPECADPQTLEGRRAAILAKLLTQLGHNQSETYWTDLIEKLGYQIWWLAKGKLAITCEDDCVDELTDEAWLFVWEVAIEHGLEDDLLACLVEHNALIETLPILHFMWDPVAIAGPADLFGVAASTDGYVVAVGASAKIIRAAGDYWKLDGSGWSDGTPDPDDQEDLYAAANIGTVLVACGRSPANFYRSVDHGATWTSTGTATDEMYAISGGIGDGVALAAGELGLCWRTFDYGASWSAATTISGAPTVQGLTRCGDGISVAAVLACAANGRIYRTPNSGTAWTNPYTGTEPLHGIAGWLLVVVAVGDDGAIIRSADGGVTFAKVDTPTAADLRAVVGSPTGRWTAVGVGGVIVQSLDDGVTWAVRQSPTTEDLRAVTRHIPSNRAAIVGANATIILE